MESIEQENSTTINGYKVVDNSIKETTTSYYTDIYSPGETKEQLEVGQEVAKPKEITGTIDTSDTSITTTDNTYTLSVANPDGKIFSIGITFKGVTIEKTFKVGYFGDTATAYADLLSQLQTWLGTDYEIAYVSGTNYTIRRVDGQEFSKTSPNLVRTITLSGFDTISIVDVIVDGVTVQLVGATHSGNASTAITYLKGQLSSSLYYMVDNGSVLEIARKDGTIPVISKTQYNLYTYRVNYTYQDTPSSGQFWNYTNTTIDGTAYYTYGTQGRAFYGDRIVRNLAGWTETLNDTYTTSTTDTAENGRQITTLIDGKLTTITKDGSCTATRCLLKQGASTLQTVSFSGNTATFNYTLTKNTTYQIVVDNNGASYTTRYKTTSTAQSSDYFTLDTSGGTVHNITQVNIDFVGPSSYTISTQFNKSSGGSDSTWTSANTALYFNQTHYLYINKTDYTAMTFSSLNHYTDPGTFPDDSSFYSVTTTNHLADITTATLTEISITLTNTGNNYFIPVGLKIKKIVINAVSSGGSSVGTRENGTQSCTAKYSTTTAFVSDYIFKTDANNYGKVTIIKSGGVGGFVLEWTTNTSNKLDYICT